MRVLITGATGYVGTHLARKLAQGGASVAALVRPESDTARLADAGSVALRAYDGTLDSLVAAVRAVQPDCVFHLASLSRVEVAREQVDALVQANIVLGVHLLEALRDVPGCRLINAGTYSQYAAAGGYEPDSLYAVTKQAFELFVDYAAATAALAAVTLVVFDVYGEDDWRPKLLTSLVDSALTGRPFPATEGHQRLDFVHVEDVVQGFVHAAQLPAVPGHRRYRLDSGARISLRELGAAIERLAGSRMDIRWGELPYRPGQKMAVLERGERLPGWQARVDLENGIRRYIAARRERIAPGVAAG